LPYLNLIWIVTPCVHAAKLGPIVELLVSLITFVGELATLEQTPNNEEPINIGVSLSI